MPVETQWYDAEEKNLVYVFEGRWTWEECYAAVDKAALFLDKIDYPVYLIVDVRKTQHMPPANFDALNRIAKADAPNDANTRGLIVIGLAGRRHQRRHPTGERAVPVRRLVLRAARGPDAASRSWCRSIRSSRHAARAGTSGSATTTSPRRLGGPVVRERLWFFAGYQYLRDADSQPGSDPAYPRTYAQDKLFAKLTWRLAPGWRLVQSLHHESWVNPDPPTLVTPFEATRRRSASVPAVTFGHLTHTVSANTSWDVRVGRFVYDEKREPSTGDWTILR